MAWSFDGEDCSGAGVATVGVQIFDAQGNQIVSDSTACTDESATYTDFAPGDYSYTLTGFSPGGNAIYGASGGLTVDSGNNDVSVDLTAETGS